MEAVGRLAGGVAHDFNNMLTVISGNVQMMLGREDLPAAIREQLEEVDGAAERSVELTRQLLAFSRKQEAEPEVLDLNESLQGLRKMLDRLIGEDITLNWESREDLWPVKMDPSQLDQILANLSVNARDAIEGVGEVTIETENIHVHESNSDARADLDPGGYIRLSVRDSGCGMEEEVQARVFDPFFTTKGEEGTGLGLATVYGIVKQNEGGIDVESEPGEGTTFGIYLPAYTGDEVSGEVSKRSQVVEKGDETVLFVDDEQTILSLGEAMLESLGYDVLLASAPKEALELLEDQPVSIDVLVTDVIMPEMNGRELAAQLRQNNPDLGCLFISGYPDDVISQRGEVENGLLFLQKPFSRSELASKLRQALGE